MAQMTEARETYGKIFLLLCVMLAGPKAKELSAELVDAYGRGGGDPGLTYRLYVEVFGRYHIPETGLEWFEHMAPPSPKNP